MRIESLINTTQVEIDGLQWNPYLGISINNKIFTTEYIFEYMNWAAEKARDRAAVLVVDIIQRINNEVFNRCKPMAAIEKTFRRADEILQMCNDAYRALDGEKKEKIVILEWPDIMYDEMFQFNSKILNAAFEENQKFKETLIAITRRSLGEITNRLDEQQIETLSHYVLYELPEIFAGFNHNGTHYNLNVYPGKISAIYTDLFEQECFKPIYSRLQLVGKIAIIEAYK